MDKKSRSLVLFAISFYWAIPNVGAQFVTIPDAKFSGLLALYFPSCMQGNKLDTTCSDILTEESFYILHSDLDDITGIQYFKSLEFLDCSKNNLTFLPRLPFGLKEVRCYDNKLASIFPLPGFLISLDCSNNYLSNLPVLPVTLENLYCAGNQLTGLPDLPKPLSFLDCSYNQLTALPLLPESLKDLYCDSNKLTSLPSLPSSIVTLGCMGNKLSDLPWLPATLDGLDCGGNQLSSLPPLPPLLLLICKDNKIKCLPKLPQRITYFDASGNLFKCIPNRIDIMDSITKNMPVCIYGDTINNPDGCGKVTEVKKIDFNQDISVYPNPGKGIINLLIPEEIINRFSDIEVYDLSNRLVYKIKPVGGLNEIDLANCAPGLYNLRLTGTKKSISKILIRQ